MADFESKFEQARFRLRCQSQGRFWWMWLGRWIFSPFHPLRAANKVYDLFAVETGYGARFSKESVKVGERSPSIDEILDKSRIQRLSNGEIIVKGGRDSAPPSTARRTANMPVRNRAARFGVMAGGSNGQRHR